MTTFRLTPQHFRQVDKAYRAQRARRITIPSDDRTSAIARAVLVDGSSQAAAARLYGVTKQRVSKLMSIYYRVALTLGCVSEQPRRVRVAWKACELEVPDVLIAPLGDFLGIAKRCKDRRALQDALAAVDIALRRQAKKLE